MRMGRIMLGVVCLALAATGCTRPPGIDGVISDEWPAMAEPSLWTPTAPACLTTNTTPAAAATLTRPVSGFTDCEQPHQLEIIHVGQFQGADDSKPPVAGSPAFKTAWDDCDAKSSAYLGGAWRERRVWAGVGTPSASAWQAGSRWYACELGAVTRLRGSFVIQKGALKGKFDSEPSLQFGCLQVDKEGVSTAKSCTEPHNSEFAGVIFWDTSFDDLNKEIDRDDDAVNAKCRDKVGDFVGSRVRTGTYLWLPGQSDWNAGDRSVRCFFWLGVDKSVSRSMQGVGASGWPLK